MTKLDVLDDATLIQITFDDLLTYHGKGSVGGLAHGFKVIERALPFLADGRPPERRDIYVETAFDGPGARDAFEMVTRAVTGGRYLVIDVGPNDARPNDARPNDADRGGHDVPEGPEGHFFFRLSHHGAGVELTLRSGHVSEEFVSLVRRNPRSPAEETYLTSLKKDMASRLMALPAADVYDARPTTSQS